MAKTTQHMKKETGSFFLRLFTFHYVINSQVQHLNHLNLFKKNKNNF